MTGQLVIRVTVTGRATNFCSGVSNANKDAACVLLGSCKLGALACA